MENSLEIDITKQLTWFDKRCRTLVFNVLEQITSGSLELIEGQNKIHFGLTPADLNKTAVEQIITAKLVVHDASIYQSFVLKGSIGVAEAFIEGKWSSPDLTDVIRLFAKAQQITDALENNKGWLSRIKNGIIHRSNKNTRQGSKKKYSLSL